MSRDVVCVMGIGEVGSSIYTILSTKYKTLKKDLKTDEAKNQKIDALHICIPYSKTFVKSVTKVSKINKPTFIIIHSTVKPGTTKKIADLTGIPAVHSPIMGVHPNLTKHIKKFKKIIGPTSKKSLLLAKKHLEYVGLKLSVFNNSEESELAKLLDTTYYGWNIVFNKEVYELCKKNKLDFTNVYEKFNSIYNENYKKEKPNVIRPILKFQEGRIGGHCIIPNLTILQNYSRTKIGEFINDFNDKI